MFAVQKKDFMGQWLELYRAQQFADAEKFRKGVAGGSNKVETRVIKI